MNDGADNNPPMSYRPAKNSQGERRRYGRRVVLTTPGRWLPNASVEGVDSIRMPVRICDISLDGLQFESTVPIEIGADLVVHYETRSRMYKISCRVMRQYWSGDMIGERFFRHGVRFTDLDTIAVQAFVDAVNPGRLPPA